LRALGVQSKAPIRGGIATAESSDHRVRKSGGVYDPGPVWSTQALVWKHRLRTGKLVFRSIDQEECKDKNRQQKAQGR
jgi:hypothetical protein